MPPPDHSDYLDLQFAEKLVDRNLSHNPDMQGIYRGMIVVRTAIVLEENNVRTGVQPEALREIRNAVLHNGFDASKNRNKDAVLIINRYFSDLQDGAISRRDNRTLDPFFSLDGSKIVFDMGEVGEPCRQILMFHFP